MAANPTFDDYNKFYPTPLEKITGSSDLAQYANTLGLVNQLVPQFTNPATASSYLDPNAPNQNQYTRMYQQAGGGAIEQPWSAKHPIASTLIGMGALGLGAGLAGGNTAETLGAMALGSLFGYSKSSAAKQKWVNASNKQAIDLAQLQNDINKNNWSNLNTSMGLTKGYLDIMKGLSPQETAQNIAKIIPQTQGLVPSQSIANNNVLNLIKKTAGNIQAPSAKNYNQNLQALEYSIATTQDPQQKQQYIQQYNQLKQNPPNTMFVPSNTAYPLGNNPLIAATKDVNKNYWKQAEYNQKQQNINFDNQISQANLNLQQLKTQSSLATSEKQRQVLDLKQKELTSKINELKKGQLTSQARLDYASIQRNINPNTNKPFLSKKEKEHKLNQIKGLYYQTFGQSLDYEMDPDIQAKKQMIDQEIINAYTSRLGNNPDATSLAIQRVTALRNDIKRKTGVSHIKDKDFYKFINDVTKSPKAGE